MATPRYYKLRSFTPMLLAACTLFSVSPTLSAQSIELEAITDFPDLTSGEVPYYIDTVGDRNVLAINAANVEYRDKYARAVTTFTGASGNYDVTITALGEVDGEGEFRFLVNGVLVGAAFNERVDVDWGEQFHTFDDVGLNSGDEIAVESSALSNGLIPENGEYAFARGRWRSLTLTFDDGTTAISETADLIVTGNSASTTLQAGESGEIFFSVTNQSIDVVATNIDLDLTAADSLTAEFVDATAIASLAGGETVEVPVTVTANLMATAPVGTDITLTATADQADPDTSNNDAVQSITVEMIVPPADVSETESSEEIVTAEESETDSNTSAQETTENPFAPADTNVNAATNVETTEISNSGGGGSLSIFTAVLLLLQMLTVTLKQRYCRCFGQ